MWRIRKRFAAIDAAEIRFGGSAIVRIWAIGGGGSGGDVSSRRCFSLSSVQNTREPEVKDPHTRRAHSSFSAASSSVHREQTDSLLCTQRVCVWCFNCGLRARLDCEPLWSVQVCVQCEIAPVVVGGVFDIVAFSALCFCVLCRAIALCVSHTHVQRACVHCVCGVFSIFNQHPSPDKERARGGGAIAECVIECACVL